jgi:predicted metal-dependent hydrolase
VQTHLRAVATAELPVRSRVLAARHGVRLGRVSVRDQRSRWGACSGTRTITLNWRLIQMPAEVADYVICHELAHIEHPNHSSQFWQRVDALCPTWRVSEGWLRAHGRELM